MWLPVLKAIAANLVVIISAFGFGTLLARLLPDSFSRLTRSVCHLIGGFGILGLILFVVGYLSFTRWTIGVVLYLNHDPEFTQLLILDRSVPAYYSDKNI
jgi:hypothetical protein